MLWHLRYLEQWIGTFASLPIGYEAATNERMRISHSFDALARKEFVSGKFGELGITYGRSINVSHFLHTEVEQNWFWDLRLPKPHSLNAVMDVCWLMQDVVSLGCDHPSALTGLVLDHPQQIDSKATEGRPIRPYMTSIGNYGSDRRGSISAGNMLFTFSEIGGLEGLAKLLDVADRYRIVVSTLVGNLYAPSPYSEGMFFNACTAAEALRRIQLKKQSINLKRELKELACQAGDVFEALVGDVDQWAKRVAKVRVNLVVHPGLSASGDKQEIHWLAESLHILVVLCLLSEAGVREGAEQKVMLSSRFYRLGGKVDTSRV